MNPQVSISQFLLDNGWVATGQCGCQPPKTTYRQTRYNAEGIVIWANDNVMEIRKALMVNLTGAGARDTRVERVAGTANFQIVYKNYFG